MTNELEKKFLDTFGIEPKFKGYSDTEELSNGSVIPCGNIKYFNTIEEMDKANYWCFNMWELNEEDKEYPQVTDRILLELLVIMTRYTDIIEGFDSVQELKEFVLKDLMYSLTQPECNIVKQQVRALFEEETNK